VIDLKIHGENMKLIDKSIRFFLYLIDPVIVVRNKSYTLNFS